MEADIRGVKEELRRMNEKFDALIRLEVRHDSLSQRTDGHADRLNRHSDRLHELESVSTENSKTLSTYERFLWVAITAVFAALSYFAAENI